MGQREEVREETKKGEGQGEADKQILKFVGVEAKSWGGRVRGGTLHPVYTLAPPLRPWDE